jgi:hypothetical protein
VLQDLDAAAPGPEAIDDDAQRFDLRQSERCEERVQGHYQHRRRADHRVRRAPLPVSCCTSAISRPADSTRHPF